ncbi:recombinase family protein [Paenibacillus jiagnxiensis]|uniref:recombinase family protein n=1 Tax=Paenibacillus jiagnxiensis TaxID=3228926 RepID=UPI0033BCD35F
MNGTKIGLFGAIYLRISRDKGEDEDTLQNHREIMFEFCREQGCRVEVYEEIVSGGRHELEARPQLQKLIDNVERYQAIFAISLDRLSRNGLVSQHIKQLCIDHDIKIITPSQTFDLSNSQEDRVLYDVSSMLAAMEYEMMGRRNKVNKMQRARRGEHISGSPAYGYRRNQATRRLEIYEPEAEVVRYIFKLYREGLGSRRIVDMLNLEGYKPKRADVFQPPTVMRIIRNPVYKGTIVYHNRKRVKQHGKYTYKILDTIVTDHAHTAIIAPEQWEQANRERMERGLKSWRLREKPAVRLGTAMLKDLLFCGVCGRKLAFRRARSGNYFIKGCSYRLPESTERCNNRGMKLSFMEEEVVMKVQTYRGRLREELELLHQDELSAAGSDLQKRMDRVEQQLHECDQQQGKLIELAVKGVFTEDELRMKKEALMSRQQALQRTQEELLQQMQAMEMAAHSERLDGILKLLDDFTYQTAEEQNETLKQFIKRIYYTRIIPEDLSKKSTWERERQEYPFSYTIEYF